ncbi:MAG: hypothetical protein HY744_31465 [Deltaproteobacteria bacterium]|nr:hypothetical protein [Deltaproteobacteria bacterium]
MATVRAVVQDGRAVIEDVSDYPDGTILELEVVAHDRQSREERIEALRRAIDPAIEQADAGRVVRGTPEELMARAHEKAGTDPHA